MTKATREDRSYDTTAKKELSTPTAQKMLRQFMSNKEGNHTVNPAYDRGYDFSFRYEPEDRQVVLDYMDNFMVTFEVAFDETREVVNQKKRERAELKAKQGELSFKEIGYEYLECPACGVELTVSEHRYPSDTEYFGERDD